MEFTEEAIFAVRRIEQLRMVHGLDVAVIKTLLGLLDEVERLRAEVRFLRSRRAVQESQVEGHIDSV